MVGYVADSLPSILIRFIAAVAIVVGLLALVAAVPAQVERVHGFLAEESSFDSRTVSVDQIEEAESILGTDVWLPIYFPDYLPWPPSSVTVQRYPDKNVTLVFRGSDQREALVIRQYLSSGNRREGTIPRPSAIYRTSPVAIGDGRGMLIEGRDGDGADRNVVYWTTQNRSFTMAGALPAEELLRMARSVRSVGHGP